LEILSTDYTDWTWLTDKSQNFTTERIENAEKVLKREKRRENTGSKSLLGHWYDST